MKNKYEIIMYWSAEDNLYIAEIPELPGCLAHGKSQQSALKNINNVLVHWIETAKEFGDPVPEPKCQRLIFA